MKIMAVILDDQKSQKRFLGKEKSLLGKEYCWERRNAVYIKKLVSGDFSFLVQFASE